MNSPINIKEHLLDPVQVSSTALERHSGNSDEPLETYQTSRSRLCPRCPVCCPQITNDTQVNLEIKSCLFLTQHKIRPDAVQ